MAVDSENSFKYYLETVNNCSADQPEDCMAYMLDSSLIVRGRPSLGVFLDECRGRQVLWVTSGEDECVLVAPAKIEGDQVLVEKNNMITPFRSSTIQRLQPLIDQVPERIPLAEVTIPDSVAHPDKV